MVVCFGFPWVSMEFHRFTWVSHYPLQGRGTELPYLPWRRDPVATATRFAFQEKGKPSFEMKYLGRSEPPFDPLEPGATGDTTSRVVYVFFRMA